MAGLWTPTAGHARAAELPAVRVHTALRGFAGLVRSGLQLAPGQRLAFVNVSINRLVEPMSDRVLWGEGDHWQTPAETLALAAGDCEDLAIAKHFLLHDCAGPSPCPCNRLLYAIRTPLDTPGLAAPHLVLLAGGAPGDPLVCDNLNPLLVPLSQRDDLRPVFSFDAAGLWRGVTGERVGDAARLKPWHRVLQRWARQHAAQA
ncbi:MAG: transglutaminase-like cysteine peptidase [Rhizobacter sp.]|nr:transglutaminase-like cysteine peptidase [Rhizobacter sp.]